MLTSAGCESHVDSAFSKLIFQGTRCVIAEYRSGMIFALIYFIYRSLITKTERLNLGHNNKRIPMPKIREDAQTVYAVNVPLTFALRDGDRPASLPSRRAKARASMLAYNGHWVRIGRTYGAERLDDWVAGSLTAILADETVHGLGAPAIALEYCMGSVPLTAGKGCRTARRGWPI
jgi:hypothetical protein